MAVPRQLRKVTVAIWGIGLALTLGSGAVRCRPSLDEARDLEQKADFVETSPVPPQMERRLRAYLERNRGYARDMDDSTWREQVAQSWREEAAEWRRRGDETWTTAWLVGAGWTAAVWGLYFLTSWLRRGPED